MPRALIAGFILLAVVCPAVAQETRPYPGAAEGDLVVRDFRFSGGETLPELRLHYVTLGTPRRDSHGIVRNGVLVLHGTTGSGKSFLTRDFAAQLFGPGQPLDATKYFVILPDSVGHGQSSKPSDGWRARFPRYTYEDMVTAQYRLLTEGLGVDHLRLIIGTSMGCMHAWLWAIEHPAFMDGLVPLACLPTEIAGRNRMMREMILDDIRNDPTWRNGEYGEQPTGLRAALQVIFLMASSARQLQRIAPTRAAADRYITHWLDARLARTDANDLLYAFDASRDYAPSPHLERIEAPVLAINSADDLINPPELGLMEQLMPRVKRGRYELLPVSEETRGHLTHSVPAVWRHHLEAFLASLP